MKGESKNDTYIQEFVPDNLRKDSFEEDTLKSKDSEEEVRSSKTSPREISNKDKENKFQLSARNVLKKYDMIKKTFFIRIIYNIYA